MRTKQSFDNASDSELMRAVQKCDQRAMMVLYKRHYAFVTAILRTYCYADDDINRGYNAVMLKVWQEASHYRRRHFLAWLHQLSRSQAKMFITQQTANSDPIEDAGQGLQRWYQTQQNIKRLPRKQRHFVEIYAGCASVEKTADIMGINADAAKLLCQKARQFLQHNHVEHADEQAPDEKSA